MSGRWSWWYDDCLICRSTTVPHLVRGLCRKCFQRVMNAARRRQQFFLTTRHVLGAADGVVVREADGSLAYTVLPIDRRADWEALREALSPLVPLEAGQTLALVPLDALPRRSRAEETRARGRVAALAGIPRSACPYPDGPGRGHHYAAQWYQGYDEAAQDSK